MCSLPDTLENSDGSQHGVPEETCDNLETQFGHQKPLRIKPRIGASGPGTPGGMIDAEPCLHPRLSKPLHSCGGSSGSPLPHFFAGVPINLLFDRIAIKQPINREVGRPKRNGGNGGGRELTPRKWMRLGRRGCAPQYYIVDFECCRGPLRIATYIMSVCRAHSARSSARCCWR